MPTEKEIKAKYKKLHDDLSEIYYDGTMGLAKGEFDTLHGQIWDGMKAELIAGGYLTIPEPSRDLLKEIDELKARLDKAGIAIIRKS